MKIRSTAEFANSRTKSGCVLQKNGDSLCECREMSERVVSSGAVKLPCFSYRGYMYMIIEIIIYIYITENTCIAHSFRQVFGQAYTCIYIILHKLTYVAYVAYHCIPWHEDIAISCSLSLSLHLHDICITFTLHCISIYKWHRVKMTPSETWTSSWMRPIKSCASVSCQRMEVMIKW